MVLGVSLFEKDADDAPTDSSQMTSRLLIGCRHPVAAALSSWRGLRSPDKESRKMVEMPYPRLAVHRRTGEERFREAGAPGDEGLPASLENLRPAMRADPVPAVLRRQASRHRCSCIKACRLALRFPAPEPYLGQVIPSASGPEEG